MKRQNFISTFINYSGITLSFLVIFMVVYAPLIQTGYYFYEDYYYFALPRGLQFDLIFNEGIINGRLLEGILQYAQSFYLHSSESTKAIRFLTIITVALFASVIYAILKRCRIRSDQAYLISALICLLPSMQLIAAYITVALHVLSALLSSLSALVVFNVAFKKEGNEQTNSHITIGIISAILLMVAALNINQPPAMMYWVMGIILFLGRDAADFSKKDFRRAVIAYFFTGFVSSAIYYVIFLKIIPSAMSFPHHRGTVISIQQIPHQIKYFLTGPLRLSMNLWNLDPSYYVLAFTGAIILIGIILNVLKEKKEEKKQSSINSLIKYLLVSLLVILSYLPKLMVTDPAYKLYLLLTLTSSIAVLFCFGIINIVRFFKFIPEFSAKSRKMATTVLLTILTIVAALSAHNNLKGFTAYHASEFNLLKKSIQEYGIVNLLTNQRIHIQRPGWTQPVPWENINMQFNKCLTTHPDGGFILSVVGQALHEVAEEQGFQITNSTGPDDGMILSIVGQSLHNGGAKMVKKLKITHSAADGPIPKDKNKLLLIDMTKLEGTPRLYGVHDAGAWIIKKITGQP